MVKKILMLLLCPILIQLSYSCSSCFGENTESFPYYDVRDYTSRSFRITGLSQHGMFVFEELSENETLAFDKLAISVQATVDYYANSRGIASFYNAAYACDPPPDGHKGTTEMLDSLVITSDHDFDHAHPKGTKLNDFFDRYSGARRISTLNEYLSQEELQAPKGIGLLLNSMPTHSNVHRFKIVLYLSSGEEYSTETITVRLRGAG